MGEPEVTPKKVEKGKVKDDGDSSSDDQDDVMFSDGEGQQLSYSAGFKGWSDDEAEDDEPTAVANIVSHLEEDQQDSGIGMGSNDGKPEINGDHSRGPGHGGHGRPQQGDWVWCHYGSP